MSVSLPPEVIEQARRQYAKRLGGEAARRGRPRCDVWVCHKGPHRCERRAGNQYGDHVICSEHRETAQHRELAFNAEDAIRLHNARRDVLEIER